MLFCLFIGIFSLTPVFAEQQISIVVPDFPPYSYLKDQQITGIGIELAKQVFAMAEIQVNFQLMPNYAKTVYQVQQNYADGFLLASQNTERDSFAVFSEPLLINRWCWYQLKDAELLPEQASFKSKARVSSYFNTNTHKWLVANNYNVQPTMRVNNLPKMLVTKRVEAVFIAEHVFNQAVAEQGIEPAVFRQIVEIEKPFGIYLSKNYLARFPESLVKINRAILQVKTSKQIQ